MWSEPRKIRIVQPGWETFTGHFGPTEFVDGVSVDVVDPVFIDRCAAEIKVVDFETEEPVGAQVRLIETACIPLDVLDTLPTATPADLKSKAPAPAPVVVDEEDAREWSEEDLMALADDKGIKGLREIGDPMGAKGRSIPELIDSVLKVQDERRRQAGSRLPREG